MEEAEEVPATVEVTAPVEEMPKGTTKTGREYSQSEASSETYDVEMNDEEVAALAAADKEEFEKPMVKVVPEWMHSFAIEGDFTLPRRVEEDHKTFFLNSGNHQLVFEGQEEKDKGENGDNDEIKYRMNIRRAKQYGTGVLLLRCLYTYVAFILCFFWLAVCIYFFVQFSIGSLLTGFASDEVSKKVYAALSLLSLPVFLNTLSKLISIVVGFMKDGWNGFSFLNAMLVNRRSNSEDGWVFVVLVIIVPCFALSIALFLRVENPYAVFLLSSFWTIMVVFMIYAVLVIALEVKGCFILVGKGRKEISKWHTFIEIIKIRTSTQLFSIKRKLSETEEKNNPSTNYIPRCLRRAYHPVLVKVHEIHDVAQVNPYFSEDTPHLLYFCCLRSRGYQGRLSTKQLLTATLCFIISLLVVLLLSISFLVWAESTKVLFGISAVICSIICLCFIVPLFRDLVGIIKRRKKNKNVGGNGVELKDLNYRKKRSLYVVATPKRWLSILLIVSAFTFLFLIPLVSFFMLGIWGFAIIFLVSVIISVIRRIFYLKAFIEHDGEGAFKELGSKGSPTSSRQVYLLLKSIVKPKRGYDLLAFLILVAALFFLLSAGTIAVQDSKGEGSKPPVLLGTAQLDSHYVPASDAVFQYHSCTFAKVNAIEKQLPKDWGLLDFAFLSQIAYTNFAETQQVVDDWFGPDRVQFISPDMNISELHPFHEKNAESSVVLKLFQVKAADAQSNAVYVVSVRGTVNAIDSLIDALLWMPAVAMQVLRAILPFGYSLNSMFPSLITYMNLNHAIPTDHLSYATDVTNFVRDLKVNFPNSSIVITGHSLGGGVSAIAGASNQIPAITFSAPNARLSHELFGITLENIDLYNYNIIPERDIFPKADDPPLGYENIKCRANVNRGPIPCHSIARTTCEIMYTCGSGKRPPFQSCSTDYGYSMAAVNSSFVYPTQSPSTPQPSSSPETNSPTPIPTVATGSPQTGSPQTVSPTDNPSTSPTTPIPTVVTESPTVATESPETFSPTNNPTTNQSVVNGTEP